MNLEDIEQKTLGYLGQVNSPLVRIEVLFDYLDREMDMYGFSREDLVDFLERHDLVRVMDPVVADDDIGAAMRDAGMLTEPSVILKERIPSRDELVVALFESFDRMGNALALALSEARGLSDSAQEREVLAVLERASALRKKLAASLGAKSDVPPDSPN